MSYSLQMINRAPQHFKTLLSYKMDLKRCSVTNYRDIIILHQIRQFSFLRMLFTSIREAVQLKRESSTQHILQSLNIFILLFFFLLV